MRAPDGGAVLRIGWDSDGDGVDEVLVRAGTIVWHRSKW